MEYILTLQRRNKWRSSQPNIQTGDIVLVTDDATFHRDRPMGRETAVYLGSDGLIEAVAIFSRGKNM